MPDLRDAIGKSYACYVGKHSGCDGITIYYGADQPCECSCHTERIQREIALASDAPEWAPLVLDDMPEDDETRDGEDRREHDWLVGAHGAHCACEMCVQQRFE